MSNIPDWMLRQLGGGSVVIQPASIQLSGSISGRVLTSNLNGVATWQPAPAGSVPDPLDISGAMIDILSGVRATFNSGVEAPSFSGNLADFSGITIDILSGFQGRFASGIIVSQISGVTSYQMSGAISGRVLTSDLSGLGTWQPPPAGGGGGGGVRSALIHKVGPAVWTNMPAAITEYLATTNNRTHVDLVGMTTFMLVSNVSVAGFGTSQIAVQFALVVGATSGVYRSMDADLSGAFNTSGYVSLGLGTNFGPTINIYTAWINLATAAKDDITIRFVGRSGNATADPNFAVSLYVR